MLVSEAAPVQPLNGHRYLPDTTLSSPSPNQHIFPLTATVNAQDHLEVGGCDVVALVRQFGSPLYILDESTLRTACRQYRSAFATHYPGESLVLYASKAWNCLALCALVASEGLGIDVVSGGELYTALQSGFDPSLIYLHGNNKSEQELALAVEAGTTIVADNWLDLKTLVALTQRENWVASAPVRVMLRFTPGIECHTHEYIRTGHLDSKFGFDPDQLPEVLAWLAEQISLQCVGLHAHIGSQIFELNPHQDLAGVIMQWFSKASSYGLPVREVNIGGGLGISYTEADDPPAIDQWVKWVSDAIVQACQTQQLPLPKLLSEPGRSIVGPACITAYTIGNHKTIPQLNRTYVSVDGGMSDNPRPITYQALYRAVLANRLSAPCTESVTIAGKHCESGDILIQETLLPPTEPGDILVIPSTGAYNYSMSSNYNRLPRPAAILVNQGEASLILQRETHEDLIRQDCLPDRLRTQSSNLP